MGWFGRLLGREEIRTPSGEEVEFSKGGWSSIMEARWAPTTKKFLEAVSAGLGLTDVVVVAVDDHRHELRGSLGGFPLRIQISNTGSLNDLTFKCALDGPYIDLEYDPEMKVEPPTLAPWDGSDSKKIVVGPQVFVEGSSADEEVAEFRKLPPALQERVIAEMRLFRIRYFRSRRDEFDILMHDDPSEVGVPVNWLVGTLKLAADVAKARGAVAPGQPKPAAKKGQGGSSSGTSSPASDPKRAAADELANAIGKQLIGAKIVDRDEEDILDVRWTESGSAVRIAIDYDFGDIEIAVRAPGVTGEITLDYDEEITRDAQSAKPSSDPWDDDDRFSFFGSSVFVRGPAAGVRKQEALLNAIGPSLLAELVAAVEKHELQVTLEDEVVATTFCDLSEVSDRGAELVRMARLLARVTSALPRSS